MRRQSTARVPGRADGEGGESSNDHDGRATDDDGSPATRARILVLTQQQDLFIILNHENKYLASMPMHQTTFQILAVLRGGVADAGSIISKLDKLNDGEGPSLPTFYRHLKSGIDAGWIDVSGDGQTERGRGRPQQVYDISTEGIEAVTTEAKRLQAVAKLALGTAASRR